jgi:ParB family chromosome partitioning protein
VREDLFSQDEGDGTADSVLVERLVQEKLERIAQDIQQREGWAWSRGRAARIWYHGEDGKEFVQPAEPDPVYTPEQQQRLDALREQWDTYDSVATSQMRSKRTSSPFGRRQKSARGLTT